jgi:hypothetical protein
LSKNQSKNKGGKITKTVPNTAPYLLTDNHRDSPVGFGVRVGKTKKTYMIQRRHLAKVFQVKVCGVGDYTLEKARILAAKKAQEIQEIGAHPNITQREMEVAELILGECMTRYRAHLLTPPEPARHISRENPERIS